MGIGKLCIIAEVSTVEGLLTAGIVALSTAICFMMRTLLVMRTDQQDREDRIHEHCAKERAAIGALFDQRLRETREEAADTRKEFTRIAFEFAGAVKGAVDADDSTR